MASESNSGDNSKQGEDSPEFRKFQQLLKQVLSVPKEKVDEQRAEHERDKEWKRVV